MLRELTGIPADAPKDSRVINTAENVSVFWSGFYMPIDAGDWQPNPPDTLPEVSYADIMRLVGLVGMSTEPARPALEPEPFDGTAIPQELKKRNQWLCWQFGERDGKTTKIPINPRTGKKTSAPEAVWSYDECTAAAEKGYGIGFSVKNGIFGIDFDHVLDENGQLKPEYAHLSEIVDKIGSYTEISPSGEGLHIFARCDDIPPECKTCRKQNVPIEMYCEKRYITVTGKAWRNPGVLRELTGDEYREIHTLLFGGAPAGRGLVGAGNPQRRRQAPDAGSHHHTQHQKTLAARPRVVAGRHDRVQVAIRSRCSPDGVVGGRV